MAENEVISVNNLDISSIKAAIDSNLILLDIEQSSLGIQQEHTCFLVSILSYTSYFLGQILFIRLKNRFYFGI